MQSPKEKLLMYATSNHPLPEDLTPSLALYREALGQDIAALEEQKQVLQHKLIQIQAEIDEARRKFTESSSFSGAIRRIPPEVIASILQFALGERRCIDRRGRIFFMQLRAVCSLWRATAFSTPDLWSALSLDLDDTHATYPNTPTNRVCGWFARAGSRFLRLEYPPNTSELILHALPRLLDLYVHRFETSEFLEELASVPIKENGVESLAMTFQGVGTNDAIPLDSAFPLLKCVSIAHQHLSRAPLVTHRHLKALHLRNAHLRHPRLSLSSYLWELLALEELRWIECRMGLPHDQGDYATSRVHPSLAKISLSYGTDSQCADFLDRLPTCPSIR